MDNKNTKEKQVNYMYFPFDYGGIRGKIKQFFTAVCANTILLAELSPLYFGAAIGADQIIFARTGFAIFGCSLSLATSFWVRFLPQSILYAYILGKPAFISMTIPPLS